MSTPGDAEFASPRTGGRTTPRELRWAMTGGLSAAGAVFAVTALVGRVSSFEARGLIEGIKPTATFAASTYIAAGTTILALMSTVIAFSISHESEFRASHYQRLRRIAAYTTALILVAIALLTVLVVPIAEADATSNNYIIVYWTVLILSALGGGLTVTIVLMLNYSVRGLVDLGTDGTSFLTVPDNAGEDNAGRAQPHD